GPKRPRGWSTELDCDCVAKPGPSWPGWLFGSTGRSSKRRELLGELADRVPSDSLVAKPFGDLSDGVRRACGLSPFSGAPFSTPILPSSPSDRDALITLAYAICGIPKLGNSR